jgi:hypothetical protein
MRCSTGETGSAIFNGGRPNLGRIPSTSEENNKNLGTIDTSRRKRSRKEI